MCEYKSIQCIEKMGKKYEDMFDCMVKAYANKLSPRILLSDSVYTLHDFEHHCFNIYKIISNVLFNETFVYDKQHGISQRELFILNLAVLFHDIGMSDVLDVARTNHSVKSAEYIQKEYEDSNRALRKDTDLTPAEIKALKAIVIAHSNVKDGTINSQENGLNSPKLIDYEDKVGKTIRTKFLAGVLRLADELDVSSERVGTGSLEQQIEEGKKQYEKLIKSECTEEQKKEIKKWENYFDSLRHWKKLHLILSVRRSQDGEIIELIVDDDYIDRALDSGNTEKALARDLVEIHTEIEKKLQEAMQLSFVGKIFGTYVFVKKVALITFNAELKREIQDTIGIRSLPTKKMTVDEESKSELLENKLEESEPQVIDIGLEKDIYREVQRRNLIKFGHYLLNERYCARDWIDTQEVVETKKILNKLVEAIVKDINSKAHKNYTILGIDLVGTLLASRIAFSLQKPLSYIVPEKDEDNNANQEIELNIEENDEVILITDVIVTFDTIQKAISKYSLDSRIDSIYTVFYRKSDKVEVQNEYIKRTFSINNMFLIELFEKEKCSYNKNKCIACNQKIRKEEKKDANS